MLPQGVLMEIFGTGILITGEPGIGKGELALELLSRGHRLIADDAPDFRVEDDRIVGSCPAPIQDLLEVRGLGLLNIRKLFGPRAILPQQSVDLLIELQQETPPQTVAQVEHRLCGERTTARILGSILPRDLLHVGLARCPAARVEAMARRIRRENAGHCLDTDLESRAGRA